ncbi:MAG: ADP-ribosyltransferase [Prevotellaceae bacterium]|jgi:hypothetical protein|nr:ADP-ribosyltransferase [Prevotellaceae bacterium]
MNDIDRAIAIVEQAIKQFDGTLPALEAKVLNELLILAKQLKTDAKGNISTSVENLKLVNQIKSKLGNIIKSKSYIKEVADFGKAFDSLATYQDRYFSGIGKLTKKGLLKEVRKSAMDGLVNGLVGAGLDQTLSRDIIDELKNAILAGENYGDLVTRLQNIQSTPANAGLLAKHSKTYAHDAINDFMGQRNRIIGEDLGLKWFMYVGSNLTTTREFCEHLTKKKYIHESEIPTILSGDIDGHQCEIYAKTKLPRGLIDGTNPSNFSIYRGGWNCGHQLVPVAAEAVPPDIRAKISKREKRVKTDAEKADILKRWEERKKHNASVLTGANDMLNGVKDFPEIDASTLAELVKSKQIAKIQPETERIGKLVAEAKIEEHRLSELIPDVKKWKAQFGVEKVQAAYDAIEKKLQSFGNLPLNEQLKKLEYEINWVADNKKYNTWEVAKAAYQKQRTKVEYLIAKENIKMDVAHSLGYAATTKSAKVKLLASELSDLLNKETPVATLQAKAKDLNAEVAKLETAKIARKAKNTKFIYDDSNYTKARKDAAMWTENSEDADKKVRGTLESVWKNAATDEKEAAYYYTSGSSYVNEPLRGQTYYGNKGRDSKKDIDNLTNTINKSSYDFDIWIQRGVDNINVESIFGVDLDQVGITDAKKMLLGKDGVEPAFASCGDSKGSGFPNKNVIYNIYCPKGTKMLYCEPFSAYGSHNEGGKKGLSWDGKAKAKMIDTEAEMLLQRGTKFKITKVEYSRGKWYIDLDVIGQI